MRHKWKNKGGTTTELSVPLALQRRPATRIARSHWHARKRVQMNAWKSHDLDELFLLGATNRERITRYQESPPTPIREGRLFDRINKTKGWWGIKRDD
jgi:hypothetical protein